MGDTERPQHEGYASPARRAYVLAGLFLVYVVAFIDRTLLNVLAEPIRLTFGVSDTVMGLLSGPVFAFLYTFLGIPLASLADRAPRAPIIALSLAVWSAMTALCGHAQSVLQFALARIGVGIGEAGCSPPSHSLIADYVPTSQRGSAFSIYTLGIPTGSVLAALGGSYLATRPGQDWRDAFVIMGGAGLALAVVFIATIGEPPNTLPRRRMRPLPLATALALMARRRAFRHMLCGGALASFIGYGSGQFMTAFWMRVHDFSLAQAAWTFAALFGISAALGILVSGVLTDRLGRHRGTPMRMAAIAMVVAGLAQIAALNAHHIAGAWLALFLMMIAVCAHYFYLTPLFALVQGLFAARMRARAAAVLLFVINMVGYVGGPPAVGWMSDVIAAHALAAQTDLPLSRCDRQAPGDEATLAHCATARARGIGYALTIASVIYVWAGFHFSRAGALLAQSGRSGRRSGLFAKSM